MRNNSVLRNEVSASGLLKTTALLYLEEALRKEEYESCKELLEVAREYGANPSEIKKVLTASVISKRGGPSEAFQRQPLKKIKEEK